MPNGPGRSLLPPRPRRSGAMRVNSSPRWRATGTSDIDDAVTPCTPRTTRRPAPHRPTRSAPPATGTSTNSNPSPAPLIDASGVMSEVLLAGLDLLPPGGAVAVRRLHHVELERAELALAAGEVDGAQRVLLELVAGEEHARELVAGAVLAAVEEDLVEGPERQPHLPVGVGDGVARVVLGVGGLHGLLLTDPRRGGVAVVVLGRHPQAHRR